MNSNSNSNLLLNTTPTALLPQLPVGALPTMGVVPTVAFADTLAAQQAGAAIEAPALPLTDEQVPVLAETAPDSAAIAAMPMGEAQDLAEPSSEPSPDIDGQTSYALAALGLWQPAALPPTPSHHSQPLPQQTPPADTAARSQPLAASLTVTPKPATALPTSTVKPLTERQNPLLQAATGPAAAEPQATAADLGLALPGLALESLKAGSPLAAPVTDGSTLALKGEPRQWQQPLLQALGDKLQVQIAGRSEQATIRLEPPLLGQVEIAIRQQGGELQVRINASHGEVARQLQHVSDNLRQDLVQRHSGEVTVQVTQGSARADDGRQAGRDPQSQQQQQQQAQDQREQQQPRRPGRALGGNGESGESAAAGFAPALTSADMTA